MTAPEAASPLAVEGAALAALQSRIHGGCMDGVASEASPTVRNNVDW